MRNLIANICYGLGIGSIAFSVFAYSAWGIDEATYIGLWVPSFFLVGAFLERNN
jgi:hypothetical protein